ncbi:hypothetical protein GXM_03304 [Nostoc sphaeroides CCNUC1]|uniref:Uncharacterized protein n=1 Tax=Nostoc sphaeroides CCNUC1 TaxID=2653204 RepID=A0A5P8VZG5_9NOSO|nr:hypothetical protein GXM_03304 [Nostoc sphaeroides CCNUC1]
MHNQGGQDAHPTTNHVEKILVQIKGATAYLATAPSRFDKLSFLEIFA